MISVNDILTANPDCVLIRGSRQDIFSGICTDSRKIKSGEVFVCLQGKNFDGHEYIDCACKNGSSAVVSQKKELHFPSQCRTVFLVPDTAKFLLKTAGFLLKKNNIRTVMITGSCGKTSTKEFMAELLSEKYTILKSQGNFNNNIGIPLSVFEFSGNEQIAVLEAGMNHPGEIEEIVRYIKPDYSMVLNVEPVHLEHFSGMAAIAEAKMELLSHASLDSMALVNSRYQLLRKKLPPAYPGALIFYRYRIWKDMIYLPDICESYQISPQSADFAGNYAPAVILARKLGVSSEQCARLLLSPPLVHGRYEKVNCGNLNFINDTYNANPTSMKLALKRLMRFSGRRIAVLGDMLELGRRSRSFHSNIGQYITRNCSLHALYTFGELSESISKAASRNGLNTRHFTDISELAGFLLETSTSDDIILLKASRGIQLERIIKLCSTT